MTTRDVKLESGHEYTLKELFQGKNRILIPDLQRDYCWGDKAWNKDAERYTELVSGFMDSLVSAFAEKPNDRLTLGLIYGYEHPQYHIQLCDGQQRLTTLFLILGMINRKTENAFQKSLISDSELEDDKEPYLQYAIRESTLYFLSDLVCEFFLNAKISINDINNQEWYFKEYALDASIQSMINAIRIIEEKLIYIDDCKKFGDFIVNNLQMLYYDMGNRTRGEKTFVIINTTGEPLTATENLKPILLGKLDATKIEFPNEENEINRETELQYYSRKWEEREEWFWRNKRSDEQTSDNALNEFFIWFWQIRLLQEKSWKDKKSDPLNPRVLFIQKPTIDANNEENPEIDRWEESIKPETVHRYFIALEKLVERSKEPNVAKVFRTIQDEPISLSWFRKSSLYIVLPLIAYLEKFESGDKFYEFVRRIRKNHFDKKWSERNRNYLDWRHILRIIELSDTEEQVLSFEVKSTPDRFKKISNVDLNEWYNEEEKIKSLLKIHSNEIELWEDYQDFMGDLSFLFSINDMLGIRNSHENLSMLQRYFDNYVRTIDLIRNQDIDAQTARLSNLFRLFMLYIGCNRVEHKPRVSWDIVGVLFSTVGRSHLNLKIDKFKEFCACDKDRLESFCYDYIVSKIKDWNLFEITELDFNPEKMIKCWLTLKVFNAIKEKVCLAYWDGRNSDEGISAYIDIERNKLFKHEPFSIENMICGFAIKAGGGGSYISYTGESLWLGKGIIDTPFAAVSHKEKDRITEQLIANKKEIDAIIDSIYNN